MDERLRAQYNSLYTAKKAVFGKGQPADVIKRLKSYLSEGLVLDIGGGEGRNALYLAEQGFSVDVLDFSDVAMENLKKEAEKKHLRIRVLVADVRQEDLVEFYDGCVVAFVLHHFSVTEAESIIKKAQMHTKPGGAHVIITFGNCGGLYERNLTSGRFYPSSEALKELYKDWQIKECFIENIETLARNKLGQQMKNDVVTLLVTKNPERLGVVS
jgi:tellurite methyltransferase